MILEVLLRLTYTQIKEQHLRNINLVGSTDATILQDFNTNFGQRYQLALAALRNFKTTAEYTFATVANQQYYPFPQGEVQVEGMVITVGSVNYPLQIITSRFNWEQLNAISIQASAIPQFYFPRSMDFGVWPTPQAVYSGNMSYRYRDRNLSVDDYTTGTMTMTLNDSTLLAGGGATFTPAMVGRWFCVTDTTIPGQGYWFLLTAYTDTTHMEMFQPWTQATATTAAQGYIIGETPDVPEELHSSFAWGTASDYYGGMQKDPDNSSQFDNLFWTGNAKNTVRRQGDSSITGGLLGTIDRYTDRDDRHLIKRKPKLNPLQYKVWATSLS